MCVLAACRRCSRRQPDRKASKPTQARSFRFSKAPTCFCLQAKTRCSKPTSSRIWCSPRTSPILSISQTAKSHQPLAVDLLDFRHPCRPVANAPERLETRADAFLYAPGEPAAAVRAQRGWSCEDGDPRAVIGQHQTATLCRRRSEGQGLAVGDSRNHRPSLQRAGRLLLQREKCAKQRLRASGRASRSVDRQQARCSFSTNYARAG